MKLLIFFNDCLRPVIHFALYHTTATHRQKKIKCNTKSFKLQTNISRVMNQREYYTHKIAKLVVAPLDLTVQRKRNLSVLAQCGFYTVTYPVSASLAFGYLLIAKKGSNNDPINMRTGLVVKAPYLFFSELLDPQNKYFEVGNKHALIPADDSNPRVRLYQNGSPTTCEGLDVIYPDG